MPPPTSLYANIIGPVTFLWIKKDSVEKKYNSSLEEMLPKQKVKQCRSMKAYVFLVLEL